MKRKLFLHIGLHKTGTSAIQRFLQSNRELLSKKSYHYIQSGQMEDFSNNWIGIGVSNLNDRKEKAVKELNYHLSLLRKEITLSEASNFILSAETLANFYGTFGLFPLANFIQENFQDIKIILYIRRQDQHIQSVYQQWIRAGLTHDSIFTFIPSYTDNFLAIAEGWANQFSKAEVDVGIYDKELFVNQSLTYDFLTRLDIEEFSLFKNQEEQVNLSFSLSVIEVLRYITKEPQLKGILGSVVDYIGKNELTNSLFITKCLNLIPPNISTEIISKFYDQNTKLFIKYLPKYDPDLFSTQIAKSVSEWKQPTISAESIQDILEILARNNSIFSKINVDKIFDMHKADYKSWYT